MHKLVIIGAGPGDGAYMTAQAAEFVQNACCIAAARRHVPLAERFAPKARLLPLEPLSAGVEAIESALNTGDVTVLVSGDPTLFSLSATLGRRISPERAQIVTLPGIGALNVLLCRLNECADGAKIVSTHGRTGSAGSLIKLICEHETTVVFADAKHGPAWLCTALVAAGLGEVDVAVGENLSYENERIVRAKASRMTDAVFGESCILRVKNPAAKPRDCVPVLKDTDFERGSKGTQRDGTQSVIPMTKEEVRMLSVCKLRLAEDSTVWDVGAGTGSVAVQCARLISGTVYAIEREHDAIALIKCNAQKLGAPNLTVVEGEAPQALTDLPNPTHVFLGGTGGELSSIFAEVKRRGGGIRVVLNAILPETAVDALRLLGDGFADVEMIQVQVSVGKKTPAGHILSANNPVYIISAISI